MKHRIDDDFLYHHMPEAERKLLADHPPEEEHRFSLRFRWKMHQLLGRKLRLEKYPPLSVGKRVLLVAAVLLFLSIGIFMSSEANRIRVFEFVIKRYPKYTEIQVESDVNVPEDVVVEPIDPSYIPEGYQISEKNLNDMSYRVRYINDEGLKLYYNENIITQSGMLLDTEDADVETVLMEGLELMVIEKNGNVMIFWHDDRHKFLLSGEVEKAEMLRMAKSIIKK